MHKKTPRLSAPGPDSDEDEEEARTYLPPPHSAPAPAAPTTHVLGRVVVEEEDDDEDDDDEDFTLPEGTEVDGDSPLPRRAITRRQKEAQEQEEGEGPRRRRRSTESTPWERAAPPSEEAEAFWREMSAPSGARSSTSGPPPRTAPPPRSETQPSSSAKPLAEAGTKRVASSGPELLDLDQLIHSIKQRKTGEGAGEGPADPSILSNISSGWKAFKEKEQLEDELVQAHKDGYLERQDFLARTDVRQFQLERAIRQKEREKRWMREQKAQAEKM